MSISSNKIQASDFTGKDIAGLPDRPSAGGWTAENLKAQFDKLVKVVVASKLNSLIDALLATTAGDSGAAYIGCEEISGVTGTTVRAILEALKTQIDNVALGSIPDYSLTDDKLSGLTGNVKANLTAHTADYSLHVKLPAAATGGTAAAYTLTDTDFNISENYILAIIPHADCAASATLNISGAGARYIRTAALANVAAAQMKAGGVYLLLWLPGIGTSFILLTPEPVIPTITSLASLSITGNLPLDTLGVPNAVITKSSTRSTSYPIGTVFLQVPTT